MALDTTPLKMMAQHSRALTASQTSSELQAKPALKWEADTKPFSVGFEGRIAGFAGSCVTSKAIAILREHVVERVNVATVYVASIAIYKPLVVNE